MGCSGSKLDDIQVVALCRDRSHLLADAVRHRDALAEAHSAYLHSLRTVGISLHRFFAAYDADPTASPQLTIPSRRKGDDFPPLSPLHAPLPDDRAAETVTVSSEHPNSCSSCGSHLHFHSSGEEDSDDDDDGHLHFSGDSSPVEHHNFPPLHQDAATTMYFNYARKGPPAPSVTVEQRPFNPNVYPVRGGTFGGGGSYNDTYYNSHSSNNGYPFPSRRNQDVYGGGPSSLSTDAYGGYPYAYPNLYFSSYFANDSRSSSFYSRNVAVGASQRAEYGSSSRPFPPPPSPPKASSWEFLNPFEVSENYYYHRNYTPSQSSREVREEEGIPELEEDDSEVVEDVCDQQKHSQFAAAPFSSNANSRNESFSRTNIRAEDSGRRTGQATPCQKRKVSVKQSVAGGRKSNGNGVRQSSVDGSNREIVPNSRSAPDGLQEIKSQFDKLSKSCQGVSKLLEAGKLEHRHRQHEEASARLAHATTCSATSLSFMARSHRHSVDDKPSLRPEREIDNESGKLSSTLQKLYVWEKKLHEEVRAEEKMRVLYDRKCRLLKHLDETGAEDQKIESARVLIKKLSLKIKIAIQVVHSISKRISKLRDEELWPQLNELIQGLVTMWQVMMEVHGRQCQITMEVQSLDRAVSTYSAMPNDVQMEGTILLALEMLNWISAFSCWVGAQKSYVKSLNGWLLKCIHAKPDITGGVAKLSPGQLGAPPVFVVSNLWSQILDKTSEKEVVEAMEAFTISVLQVWKHYYIEMRQRLLTNGDMVNRLTSLDREDQKIQKAVNALNKRLARSSHLSHLSHYNDILQLSSVNEIGNLQSGLKQMFQAMQKYADKALEAYRELCIRIEQLDRNSDDSS